MRGIALCFIIAVFWASPVEAGADEALTFHAGSFDTFRGTESGLIGIEYHADGPAVTIRGKKIGHAAVISGGSVTGRLGGYLYVGGRFEIPIGSSDVSLAPSFAPGLFLAGRGKNLGGALEFRSGIEAALRLDDGASVGLGLFHYSNGRLYEKNPGSEALMGVYRFPLRTMLGL